MMPGQVSNFLGFEPPILAVAPATLPLSYDLKPLRTRQMDYARVFTVYKVPHTWGLGI